MMITIAVNSAVHPQVAETCNRLVDMYNEWDDNEACHLDKYCDNNGKTRYTRYLSKTDLLSCITAIATGICIRFSDCVISTTTT